MCHQAGCGLCQDVISKIISRTCKNASVEQLPWPGIVYSTVLLLLSSRVPKESGQGVAWTEIVGLINGLTSGVGAEPSLTPRTRSAGWASSFVYLLIVYLVSGQVVQCKLQVWLIKYCSIEHVWHGYNIVDPPLFPHFRMASGPQPISKVSLSCLACPLALLFMDNTSFEMLW